MYVEYRKPNDIYNSDYIESNETASKQFHLIEKPFIKEEKTINTDKQM